MKRTDVRVGHKESSHLRWVPPYDIVCKKDAEMMEV